MVFASVVKLFFLFRDSSVNLLFDLSKLKLSSKDLVLLSFKSTLSLLKSSLEFLLFSLKSTALFVKFMDGASTITKLIKKILDFISKVLVLTADNVKLLSDRGSSVCSLILHGELLKLIVHSGLGLLSR